MSSIYDFKGWIIKISTVNLPSEYTPSTKVLFKKREIPRVIPQLPKFKLSMNISFLNDVRKED